MNKWKKWSKNEKGLARRKLTRHQLDWRARCQQGRKITPKPALFCFCDGVIGPLWILIYSSLSLGSPFSKKKINWQKENDKETTTNGFSRSSSELNQNIKKLFMHINTHKSLIGVWKESCSSRWSIPISRSSIDLQFCVYAIKFTKKIWGRRTSLRCVSPYYHSLVAVSIRVWSRCYPFLFYSFSDKLYLKGITVI
jgi:hypothetical protein